MMTGHGTERGQLTECGSVRLPRVSISTKPRGVKRDLRHCLLETVFGHGAFNSGSFPYLIEWANFDDRR